MATNTISFHGYSNTHVHVVTGPSASKTSKSKTSKLVADSYLASSVSSRNLEESFDSEKSANGVRSSAVPVRSVFNPIKKGSRVSHRGKYGRVVKAEGKHVWSVRFDDGSKKTLASEAMKRIDETDKSGSDSSGDEDDAGMSWLTVFIISCTILVLVLRIWRLLLFSHIIVTSIRSP